MLPALVLLALTATPRELNDAGMKAYRAKSYEKAAELFRQSLAIDPDDAAPGPSAKERAERARLRALTHHNLACVMALLRKQGKVCVAENYRDAITEQLIESVRSDPSRLERATTDPDLANVRDTLGFQSLLGLSAEREADLPALLSKVHWWSEGVGAWGSLHDLVFFSDGTVTRTTRRFSEEGKPLRPAVTKGQWKLSGRALQIRWPDGQVMQGEFSTGLLMLDQQPWRDEPAECDA